MKFNIFLFLFVVIFIGCEKAVDINVHSEGSQLVVEGYIQQGYPSYVFLTRSEGFFDPINSDFINNISVNDAEVYIRRQDGVVHQLNHVNNSLLDSLGLSDTIQLPFDALYIDLDYQQDDFSQIGYDYKLIIIWQSDTITATTSIPPQYPIDSVWVERKDILESNHKCYIWARINDPDTIGNCALIHFKRDVGWKPMDPLFIECAIPARSDQIVNGEDFKAFFARSGRFSDEDGVLLPYYGDRYEDGNFVRKDIVLLRISHVDFTTYNFWRSVQRSRDSGGNPFSEPSNLSSNINGGLGVWGGYGVSYYYVPIVPDTIIYSTYDEVKVFEIF